VLVDFTIPAKSAITVMNSHVETKVLMSSGNGIPYIPVPYAHHLLCKTQSHEIFDLSGFFVDHLDVSL
jgi:hypothetical protein